MGDEAFRAWVLNADSAKEVRRAMYAIIKDSANREIDAEASPACIVCGTEMYQDEDMPQVGWSCPGCGAFDDEPGEVS
jgi:rubrerythrin